MKFDYDVIIVGSGVAGALCASKLSALGNYKILILEAGDNGIGEGQRLEFHHVMDRQGNRGDMFAPYLELPSRNFAPAPEKATKTIEKKDEEKYYDYSTGPEGSKDTFRGGYNRMVGGSSWSWRGNCPRYLPVDFNMEDNYGIGRNWPIDYNDIEPYYVQAEYESGVSGNHTELDGVFGGHRSKPFPMPGIPLTYSDTLIKAKIEGKVIDGVEVKVTTTPQARNSVPFDGRPACEGHSNCIPLCPIHAKYDATSHLRKILVNPNVKLKSAAMVVRLAKDANGLVTQVIYRDWKSDNVVLERMLTAPIVVLAAHAIESPKLLLMSGLANSSDQVGRNLMDHIQSEVAGLFPTSVFPFRGPQSVTGLENFRDGPFRNVRSGFRMTIGNDGWGRTGSPSKVIDNILKEKGYGPTLLSKAAEEITKMVRLSFSTEMLPHKENRVQLSTKLDDKMRLPRPLITFQPDSYCEGGLVAGMQTSLKLFEHMGVKKIEKKDIRENGKLNWNTAAHIMGTCIMGSKPSDSVVDRWGRSHDHPNLYIAGSSVFATGATANPTLTLAALTLRTAQAIHRQLRNGGHA